MSNVALSSGKLTRWFRRGPWEVAAMTLIAAAL